MKKEAPIPTLIERTVEKIRSSITAGDLLPGARLSEASLSERLGISRNTLREVFRLLTQEGLLRHEPHRGVSVAQPDMAAIVDIYRLRRLIECDALLNASTFHPAIKSMARAVDAARQWQATGAWRSVGTENMRFHSAIVELTDSVRLIRLYRQISAELRLAFGYLNDSEMLHAPYIEKNGAILALLQAGNCAAAAEAMNHYLLLSERMLLATLARERRDER